MNAPKKKYGSSRGRRSTRFGGGWGFMNKMKGISCHVEVRENVVSSNESML